MENKNTLLNTNLEGSKLFQNLAMKEFLKRQQKNPSYSLRAFALFLQIDQSLLSKIVNGHRAASKKLILRVGPKLGLKPSTVEQCLETKNIDGVSLTKEYVRLLDDEFELISSWYSFAILELMKTKDFKSSVDFVSKRLGVHKSVVAEAITRLEKLGFIEVKDGEWVIKSRNNSWTNTEMTSGARKNLQEQLLIQATTALNEVDHQKRDHGSLTVAIDSRRLPEFKEKLKEVRRELDKYFQPDNSEYNEVYQLTISFFPLTKNKGE